MANRLFTKGVHDLGAGLYAYVQPDGTWGFSNAGLVASHGETLLIDTLMSVKLTREMLGALASAEPMAREIGRVVNTHANPDHFFGNEVLADAEIISTSATAEDIAAFDPRLLTALDERWQEMGEAGEFLFETMGRRFDYAGTAHITTPNRTFERQLTLQVGDKTVVLTDLGPAHTRSDTIVHVAQDRVVFTGDLLFNEGHPIMWAGPVENWIAACRHIEALAPEVVVPGHGPVTDIQAVRNLRAYFEYLREQARARFEAGMGWEEAALDIHLHEYRGWSDPERIVANVFSLYRQFGADVHAEGPALFAAMRRWQKAQADHCPHHAGCGHQLDAHP